MIFNWTIKNCELKENDQILAERILCEFGIDKEDIEFGWFRIIGVPKVKLKWNHTVSAVRISVYDIKLRIDHERKEVKFQFRLYKLLVIALIFFLFISLILGNVKAGLLFSSGALIFFGISTFIQLAINLVSITDILKPKGKIT